MVYDFLVVSIGGFLDGVFNLHVFSGVIRWLMGLFTYGLLFLGVHLFFVRSLLHETDIRIRTLQLLLWLVLFTIFYYFHTLDRIALLQRFSMPVPATASVKSYYWIATAVATLLVYKKQITSLIGGKH